MKIKQINEVVNGALKAVFGETDLTTATNLTDLVAMGASALATTSGDNVDNLYKELLDRVYKVILSTRRYVPTTNGIVRDYETYGAILEKVYYEPLTASPNSSHDLKTGDSIDPFKVTLNKISVKLFNKRTSWEVPYTVQSDVDLRSAFLSEEALCSFIEQLALMAENSLNAQIEAVEQFTICNFIAEKYAHYYSNMEDGVHVVNLLGEYLDANPSATTTSSNYLYDVNFLRFSAMTIKLFYNKLASGKYTTIFNTEKYKRFTRPEDARVMLLSDFNVAMETYLQSDTYHKSLVELPQFSTVPYWQGSGANYTTEDCATINVTSGNESLVAPIKGVVGFIFDIDALGITVWNKRTTSQYNGRGEYNNYWLKADVGLFNDLSENAVVFVVQDTE